VSARRWIVQPGDGPLSTLLVRVCPDDPRALAEGRVFLGPRRLRDPSEQPAAGDEILVYPPRPDGDEEPALLDRQPGLLALSKPAALPTIADHRGDRCLLTWAAETLKLRLSDLHPTSRLDVGVSGVVLVATTAEARARLVRAREEHTYRRRYVALATRAPDPPTGRWAWPLGRASDPRLRAVNGRDPESAETGYSLLGVSTSGQSLLLLEPRTGRTHQLRVHCSHAGLPLLGDGVYGGPVRLVLPGGGVLRPGRIALHARSVEVPGIDGAPWRVEAPVPPALLSLWARLGGAAPWP
jgi:23S rRNA-/tRNA-specific pseudouridylate synthase